MRLKIEMFEFFSQFTDRWYLVTQPYLWMKDIVNHFGFCCQRVDNWEELMASIMAFTMQFKHHNAIVCLSCHQLMLFWFTEHRSGRSFCSVGSGISIFCLCSACVKLKLCVPLNLYSITVMLAKQLLLVDQHVYYTAFLFLLWIPFYFTVYGEGCFIMSVVCLNGPLADSVGQYPPVDTASHDKECMLSGSTAHEVFPQITLTTHWLKDVDLLVRLNTS